MLERCESGLLMTICNKPFTILRQGIKSQQWGPNTTQGTIEISQLEIRPPQIVPICMAWLLSECQMVL